MADPFFYCATLGDTGEQVQLTTEESRHLAAARRYRQGDEIWLFDGRGTVASGTLTRADRAAALVTIRAREHVHPPTPVIHLAAALPKGDRQATLLDMATQLGMASFTPLLCERSVTKPVNPERLQRLCLEACKQSRCAHVPELRPAQAPLAYTSQAVNAGATVWVAHAGAIAQPLAALMVAGLPATLSLLVGPEGGFSATEAQSMVAVGGRLVSLGDSVLRIETAAVALLAALRLATA